MSCERCDKSKNIEWLEKGEAFVCNDKFYQYTGEEWIKTPIEHCPWCGENLSLAKENEERVRNVEILIRSIEYAMFVNNTKSVIENLETCLKILCGRIYGRYLDNINPIRDEYQAWQDEPNSSDLGYGLSCALMTGARRYFGVERECSFNDLKSEVLSCD